jgi:flagellar motility protein MotE (MotC chaperone)
MRIKFRFLTVTIFAASLVLTVRLGDLWQGLEVAVGSRSVAESITKQPPLASKGASSLSVLDAPVEEDMFTEEEIKTLQDLAVRREELDRRERELEIRDALLEAAEKRIDGKIIELRGLKEDMESLLTQYDEEELAKIQSLVKIYENMKPKDAARIFGKLEMEILLEVVGRMREAKVAPILAKMDPAKAQEVTAELAQQSQLSDVTTDGGE